MESPSPNSSLTPQVKQFAIKTAIVFAFLMVTVNMLFPDFSAIKYSIKKAAKDEKTRTLLLSFVQNPAALYRASDIDEKNGKLNNSVMEMELAIGLLEMHNTRQQGIDRYSTRLNNLKAQLKNTNALEKSK